MKIMSLFGKKNSMEPMCSMNTRERHQPSVLFRTRHGVVNILDIDSIKRFQVKSGIKIDGKLGPMTKEAIRRCLLDPSDIGALDKAIPTRTKRGYTGSTQETDDLVDRLIRES